MVVQAPTRKRVYEECADDLTGFATSLVGPDDAPDVVSQAVIRAMWSKGWREVRDPRAYLYRAVLNESRMHHRSAARRRRREQRVSNPGPHADPFPDVDVWRALQALTVRQRAFVYLTYWEDRPCAEIAADFSMSERSVRRYLQKARSRLQEVLDD
jgi:RNA polymerase sigma-70 factor (ECF subfamily)